MVDARPAGAPRGPLDGVVAAVAAARHVRTPLDPALAEALLADDGAGEARATLTRAQEAYGALRCEAARPLAEEAAGALLVAGVRDEPLVRAFVIAFLCAHAAGDTPGAAGHALRLRALAADPPAGVPAEVWARYPEIDAGSNSRPVAVLVESDPAGAQVSANLSDAGTTPLRVALAPGRHWLLLTLADQRELRVVEVPDKGALEPVRVTFVARDKRWESLADRVRAWRGGAPVEGKSVSAAMRAANLVLMVVLVSTPSGEPRVEIWRLRGAATRVAQLAASDGAGITRALEAAAVAPAPAVAGPRAPRKPPASKRFFETRTGQLVIAGLLVAGAGLVYLGSDAGDVHQRIVVTGP